MKELNALPREMGLNDNSSSDIYLLTLLMERFNPKIPINTKNALNFGRNNYILLEIFIKNLLCNLPWQSLGAFAKFPKATVSFIVSVRPSVLNFLDRFSKNPQISNFIKIRPVAAELLRADGQTDRHDEAKSRSI
jgi:hypothetical protein